MTYLAILLFSLNAHANLVDGRTLENTTMDAVVNQLDPSSVLIVSELHGLQPHHDNQIFALKKLGERFRNVSVGMEFFDRDKQEVVDRYLGGELQEEQFLNDVHWMGPEFRKYQYQVLFPTLHGGTTIGLNMSRLLTTKVAKNGIDGLSPEDQAKLPPNFQMGNDGYFERFKAMMEGHLPPTAKIENYFQAHSIWDDTMAWTAKEFLDKNPNQVLMIIVGDFHASHGGGLPDRLKARGIRNVVTISQVDFSDATPEQQDEMINPAGKWGPRADFVWISR
jgi:aminopeptidase N